MNRPDAHTVVSDSGLFRSSALDTNEWAGLRCRLSPTAAHHQPDRLARLPQRRCFGPVATRLGCWC